MSDKYKYVGGVAIPIEKIGTAIAQQLDVYSEVVLEQAKEAIKEAGKKGAKEAKHNVTPDYTDRSGDYRKSISNRTTLSRRTFPRGLIYAKGHEYSLTHLLENGHKLWNKPTRKTRSFKHWANAQDLVEEELPKLIVQKIRGY